MTPQSPWYASYVGLPYKVHGRGRDGVDCWSLIRLIWKEQFGFDAPSFEGLKWDSTTKDARRESVLAIVAALNSDIARYREIKPGEEQPFDGVILRMRGAPMHCGLMVAPHTMIHVEDGCGSCIEDLRSMRWGYRNPSDLGRVIGFYRPPGAPSNA